MNIVTQLRQTNWVIKKMAAQAGLEPATNWLTVNHSTNWVTGQNVHIRKTPHQPRGSRITTTELWGSLFNYAVTKLYRCRHPNASPQGNHLHSTIFRFFDSPKTEINAFGSSQITMSEWPVPTLWSLTLISSPSHRPSTFELCLFESYPLVE